MPALKLHRFLLLLLLAVSPLIRAQQTQVYVAPDAKFRDALDLYEKQKYADAEQKFDQIVNDAADKNDLLVIDAQYYAALCSYELFHKDAEIRLKQFLADHPESPKCSRVKFTLGRYNYRKKKYEDVLVWFRQVEIYDLQGEELSEYYFKRGYAHYELGHIDSARTDFFEIKDLKDSKYASPATYYYSHIAYMQGNYETALQGFTKLSNDATFGPVVPYYIAQIYFLQGRYNDVINYAPPLLDSAKRAPEISHLIGASYYRTNRYKQAIPFLERYHTGTRDFSREDAYELGYAYYKSDSCNAAIEYFQEAIADSSDALAQNSWYHLADCYLKTGNKLAARNAFGEASKIKIDPVIREDALFNFARLSYELSFNPFNEAITALNDYLYEYPNTPRHDEAYTLLTNVYLASKNYKEALESIEKIKLLPPTMQSTYQQIAYNRAIELYQVADYDNALTHFDKSLTYPINRELNSNAHYWKGECYYAKAAAIKDTANYSKAIVEYKAFLYTPGASVLPNYNTANYNIAYCYFQQGQISKTTSADLSPAAKTAYTNSMVWFRKYIQNKSATDSNDRIFDAYLRMGDGYFRLHDFANSADFYGKAADAPTSDNTDKDYAMFQQAMALGYQGKSQEKADVLKKMREKYPESHILDESRLQEARTLHDLRKYDEALAVYQDLYNAQKDKTNKIALECLKNMGLIYRAKNDPDNALTQFKKAVDVSKKQGTSDFKDLMTQIKEIYVLKGQLDEWEKYAESQGFSEPVAVADSTTWAVANKFNQDGNCTEVLNQTAKYIQKYPNGIYITDIQYMRAECANKNNDMATALTSYLAVIEKGETKYKERSVQQSAIIYYKQKDYANASVMYGRLEQETKSDELRNSARVNLMNCWLYLGNIDSSAVYAAKVLNIKKLGNDIYGKAHYVMGKSTLAKGDKTAAEKHFKDAESMLPNTEYAAEARYQLCWIKFDNKDFKGAEKALLKEINDYAGFSYWSGKGWLLLSDDYLALKDTFQARFVLQNYITNGDVPELVEQAKQKLAALDAAKQKPSGTKEDDLVIPQGGNENEGGGQ